MGGIESIPIKDPSNEVTNIINKNEAIKKVIVAPEVTSLSPRRVVEYNYPLTYDKSRVNERTRYNKFNRNINERRAEVANINNKYGAIKKENLASAVTASGSKTAFGNTYSAKSERRVNRRENFNKSNRNISERNTAVTCRDKKHGAIKKETISPAAISQCSTRVRNNGSAKNFNNRVNKKENFNKSNRNQNRNEKGFKKIGFFYIKNLLEENPDQIILKLNGNNGYFDSLTKEMSNDALVLNIHIFAKISSCDFCDIIYEILQKAFTAEFIAFLCKFICQLKLQSEQEKNSNSYFWSNIDNFWYSLINITKTMFKFSPVWTCDKLSQIINLVEFDIVQIEIMQGVHISDDIKKELSSIKCLMEKFKQNIIEHKKQITIEGCNEKDLKPPENYRELPVYPTCEELLTNNKGFLRKNVVDQPYNNVEHYLDVQFRLLREDFVGPLRSSINSYVNGLKKKLYDIKIIKNVIFLREVLEDSHYCYLLQFETDVKKKKRLARLENSKRFIYGSLLCFTKDNFKSLIFGTVVERKLEYLSQGQLIVGFEENIEIDCQSFYTMVESTIFFVPYFHVLNALKFFDEENLPMQKYLINTDTSTNKPIYLVNNERMYPDEDFLKDFITKCNFNDSQRDAFVSAVDNEFTLIQGPPGTGKTYVGTKIAEYFLKDKYWYGKNPMLVVCFTNHALDQFLEGIIEVLVNCKESNIIRVGGQSKNEKLKRFNLQNHKSFKRSTLSMRIKMKDIAKNIANLHKLLTIIKEKSAVLDFSLFKNVVPDFPMWFKKASVNELQNWITGNLLKHYKKLDSNETIMTTSVEIYSEDLREAFSDEYNENIFDDDIEENSDSHQSGLLINLEDLKEAIIRKKYVVDDLKTKIEQYENDDILRVYEIEKQNLRILYGSRDVLKKYLECDLDNIDVSNENINTEQPKLLPISERWKLYFSYLKVFINYAKNRITILNDEYRRLSKVFNESKNLENVSILRQAEIIGMTTTGAARLHSSLMMLQSPIVIVEEAAEILEAHVITSLTKHCKQLILIGDHKQLRPSTSNYNVEKYYDLGISLFERMVLNNIQLHTLDTQHRMKPEIAALISPIIYPHLINHQSVENRPKIYGTAKDIYFLHHEYQEEIHEDNTTKINEHEAKFLVQLARHLILNGHNPNDITILSAYLGQMFVIQREKKLFSTILNDVRVTCLDNYQGEECHIILLSLVRNNSEKKIGFLATENRICVALSRARNGMYIMGNMDHLCQNSEVWRYVREKLESQDMCGNALPLQCQMHPETITKVKTANDFMKICEGGCERICGSLLPCNHLCQRLCHFLDRQHSSNICLEKCTRMLCENPSHVCMKLCNETCGPCTYLVKRELNCGHQVELECHIDFENFKCREIIKDVKLPCDHIGDIFCSDDINTAVCKMNCETRLNCGHACRRKCHFNDDPDHLKYECLKPCARPAKGCADPENDDHRCKNMCFYECHSCEIIVKKKRSCNHIYEITCASNVEEVICERKCRKTLECGHPCKVKCYEPCPPCQQMVNKEIPDCGHTIKINCSITPNSSMCNKKCEKVMSCGHLCLSKCMDMCDPSKCKQIVDVKIKALCGHYVTKIKCSIKQLYDSKGLDAVPNLHNYCTEPCSTVLTCSTSGVDQHHLCKGTCGECYQGRVHKQCREKCGAVLVCGHTCQIPCREACKPCTLPCRYRCGHSICKKKCGEPCESCKEQCSRRCSHSRCTKLCGEICSVPPCNQPCSKVLKCKHPCVGFCGEPCPQLCRICDKEELQEIFFGNEEEDDARFVVLSDCNHIIESSGMENWLQASDNNIGAKVCPKCKTPIINTARYNQYVKQSGSDIAIVKIKLFGTFDKNKQDLIDLKIQYDEIARSLRGLDVSWRNDILLILNSVNINKMLTKKGEVPSRFQLGSLKNKLNFTETLVKLIKEYLPASPLTPSSKETLFTVENQFVFIRKQINKNDFSQNELIDINNEISRLNRMFQLKRLLSETYFDRYNQEIKRKADFISSLLHSLKSYTTALDNEVKNNIFELQKLISQHIKITEVERKEIINAMKMKKGHWFKCPNNHIYAIGECGGAMEVGKCPECGVPIGGTNHALLGTNSLASEMDGATYAAFSEIANNLNNFHL